MSACQDFEKDCAPRVAAGRVPVSLLADCGQRAVLDAIFDTLLLVDVALNVCLHALRGSAVGVAELGIVSLV
jgi:hypothetical protein